MLETITAILLSSLVFVSPLQSGNSVLAQKSLSLTNRHPDPWVNKVFADNIVLNLHYLKGNVISPPISQAGWEKVREPFEVTFTLNPGETFAFQEDVLPEFKGKVVKTTKATFNWQQGFRGSGWLIGDGVCHLASFINWTAKEAGLEVVAPINHNFASIPDVPREFGTSIFYLPGNTSGNARQNLYITNNFEKEVTFNFAISQGKVIFTISK